MDLAATDNLLAAELKAAAPHLFPYYEYQEEPVLSYTPNDYFTTGNCHSYLDYINARTAWDYSKGDPDVVIGITDSYIDDSHEDLAGQIKSTVINTPGDHHGTTVSGFAAGRTDNNKGIAAIGFNCGIEFSSRKANAEMEYLSRKGNKILNASWRNNIMTESGFDLRKVFNGQEAYNKIYENGTSTVAAAGNSREMWHAYMPDGFSFPASYDNVISVTNVGWLNAYGSSAMENIQGVHDRRPYDDLDFKKSYARNSKVDICAPAIELSALDYVPGDPSAKYKTDWGTSFASPMVAGTLGLLLSANKEAYGGNITMSPYQREYLLKKHANTDMLSLPENAAYAGKLGAGRLDAGELLEKAHLYNVNDAETQTMYIKGIEINSICAPGSASNGVLPKLKPIIVNGTPPFRFVWEKVPDGLNSAELDDENIEEPTVIRILGLRPPYISYRLTVYDNSKLEPRDLNPTAQKVAMKTFRIPLLTSGHDLAMRDSYVDMLKEMNNQKDLEPREWDIWTSPDIWNRKNADGIKEHENPEFKSTANYAYTRVRNVGCAPSPASARLRLYWSKQSTGESWEYDWKTSNLISCCGGPMVPAGREITTGTGIDFGILQPGEETIIAQPWYPVNPALYEGAPASTTVCFLGRIEEDRYYTIATNTWHEFGMKINEQFLINVTGNVRNNNNIVTRNMELTNLNPFDRRTDRRQLIIANAHSEAKMFNFEFASQRSIFKHFAGDFSSLGNVILHLGSLYDRWDNAGALGTYASKNAQNKTVTFNGNNTLSLEGLALAADERFTIELEFALHSTVSSVAAESQHLLHARQYDVSALQEVYGAVNYALKVSSGSVVASRFTAEEPVNGFIAPQAFSLSPNPTSGKLNLVYFGESDHVSELRVCDITGRTILTETINFKPGVTRSIDIGQVASGLYLISIPNASGKTEVYKIVKE